MHGDLTALERPGGQAGVLPTWRRIAEDLIEAIGRGDYAKGAALPTALVLAESYGVHRHTVRQAFRHLQDLGLVSVEQGRGTFVMGPRIAYPIGRRTRLRENLRAAGFTIHNQILDHAEEPADHMVAGLLAMKRGETVIRVRMRAHANGAPMSMATLTLSAIRFPRFMDVLRQSETVSVTETWRALGVPDYVRAWTKVTARLATDEEATLLGMAAGTAVMQTRALDAQVDGLPLAHVETTFIGDRIELVIEP
jgi:GntR family phosphonate transport system transcriptional regulator